jgi:protein arginine kinase activator
VPPTLCQSCKQNPATIHFTEIKDAEKRELHVCEACAQSQNLGTGPLLAALPPMLAQLVGKAGSGKAAKASSTPAPRCPICDITFAEFREKGRLGCPNDYPFFRESLDPLLEKIHGAAVHRGRLPRAADAATPDRCDKLLRLRRELHTAVKAEQYETAARLRDEIRQEEAEGHAIARGERPPSPPSEPLTPPPPPRERKKRSGS